MKNKSLRDIMRSGGDILEETLMNSDEEIKKSAQSTAANLRPVVKAQQIEIRLFDKLYPVIAVILGGIISAVLIITASCLPRYGEETAPVNNEVAERYLDSGAEETGAANLIAGVILDYRAFDTLGESHVLFTAVGAVLILLLKPADKERLKKERKEDRLFDLKDDVILREIVRILFLIDLLFGIYIILNGHISPGGGFSGGSIIGAGLILYSLAFGFEATERFMNFKVFKSIVVTALLFYSLAKGYSFYMGAHHLDNGIPLGTLGNILSAGLILPLNIAVGCVVACTMYSIYSIFSRGRI